MKRKYATYRDWPRLRRRRFVAAPLAGPGFVGQAALLVIDDLADPPALLALPDGESCYADTGSSLLTHYPAGAHALVTTHFDRDDRIVQWYIDIVRRHGLGTDSVPWYDDLYLDIVVLPDGRRYLLDADELDEALAAGKIDREEWALARAEAARLLAALEGGPLPAMALAVEHLAILRALPMRSLTHNDLAGGQVR